MEEPFEIDETKEEKFTLQDGGEPARAMMRQWGNFRYAERGGAQIVSLPYKGGMSMRVRASSEADAFPKVLRELTSIVGTSWTRAMGERDGQHSAARFRIETQADLGGPLKAMECRKSSTQRAALEGISDRKPLYLMAAMQQGFVEVNEKGTEAAAVSMLMDGASEFEEPPLPPFEMT